MRKHNGFTLIEILLVLVLLSLTAVAVITTLPTSQKDLSKQYAQSFFQRLQLLNEEAVLSGKDFGVRVDDTKKTYTLLSLTAEGWKPLEMKQIPSKTKLEDDIALQLDLGGGAWDKDDRLFEPGSLFEDMFADETEEKKVKPPQVFIFSSAEVTPFTLSFSPQKGDAFNDGWRVIGKESGQILLVAPGEEVEEDANAQF
ncbi:type II secretion system minor pseudopilin GspH [Vibrio parahaemolyticus]|uniref:type II secretion system minor pseudopilin GspH n=1 Tax=Vibrio parahaemolyticus TaxID=670 RepID=UPI0003F59C59|nr:type II secretion system minor pseudopilin GspH [Vibrio parahaemolyticus]EGQ8030846.1 type II secretion system minor pseudopilin GspH [Vibrio parahaemolyticus]EGQ8259072.1 type II secretion system minor pseudopilin GspH [Vibrio parahaemolyticus]EGQ8841083.1 type II secretion system protein GspH [Vibrio parahaemolyticus]EGQ8924919.1 type II secretion system protein GspH [Vibrio parahaemolyticus]EGQ9508708.1 type II secretion system protein GspH [Vibrio parahaemolyticus]